VTLEIAFRHSFPSVSFDIAFTAPTPGTTALFGPSGSGKSTIANVVEGLLRPASCRLVLDGTMLADTETGVFLPPERRRIGVVFQDSRLFPHLSVAANLAYGARRAGGEAPLRQDDVVELLGIGALLGRRPHTLSGGERQRVAIGRALLAAPRLMVMDEPLGSLDEGRKAEILPYLALLKANLGLPILYVTHSLNEVARLADTLVLIRDGSVLAAGRVDEILARADLPLARRDDAAAVLPARVVAHDPERRLTEIRAGGRSMLVPLLTAPPGTVLRVRVPAREVILASEPPRGISLHNVIPGTVRGIVEDADRHAVLVEIALDGAGLLSRVTPDAVWRMALAPGAPVLALVKSVAIEALDG